MLSKESVWEMKVVAGLRFIGAQFMLCDGVCVCVAVAVALNSRSAAPLMDERRAS